MRVKGSKDNRTMNEEDESILNKLYDTVVTKAAKLVVPDSLVHVPADIPFTEKEWSHQVNRSHNKADALKQSLKRLRPGDIVLTRTPGMFYNAARASANSKYDHCVVVAHNGMVYHVGPPTVRRLHMERIITPQRYPCVFRSRLKPKQIHRFLYLLERNLGKRYDTLAAYKTLATLSIEHMTGASFGRSKRKEFNARNVNDHMVCTDTILSALCKVSKAFTVAIATCEPTLDCVRFENGAASLEDVLRLHRHRPDLLVRIPLVTSLFPNDPPPLSLTPSASTMAVTMKDMFTRAKLLASVMNQKLEETLEKPELLKVTDTLSRIGLIHVETKEAVVEKSNAVVEKNQIVIGNRNGNGKLNGKINGRKNGKSKNTNKNSQLHSAPVSSSETSANLSVGRDDVIDEFEYTGSYGDDGYVYDNDGGVGGIGGAKNKETNVTVKWKKMQGALLTGVGVLAWTQKRKIMNKIFRATLLLLVARYGIVEAKRRWDRNRFQSKL